MKTKLYLFRQNNSGGSFVMNDKFDINVYIEATNPYEADEIAQKIGIYFDGCSIGVDCQCCGDRWKRATEDRAEHNINDLKKFLSIECRYIDKGGKIAIIYLLDGRKVTIYHDRLESYIQEKAECVFYFNQ